MTDASREKYSIFWFRRDLRLEDNHGLYQALQSGFPVFPIFIFDSEILKNLASDDARVGFIHSRLVELNIQLGRHGSRLQVFHGEPHEIWREIFSKKSIHAIYCNEDYEPYAIQRDRNVAEFARGKGAGFFASKDQVIFAKSEVVKDDGSPYRVFTPYSRKWKSLLQSNDLQIFPSENGLDRLAKSSLENLPTLENLGFKLSSLQPPPFNIVKKQIEKYAETRNLLDQSGTTHLGLYLRFGTGSIRKLVKSVRTVSEIFLNELIWREFFMQVLFHSPQTVDQPFDPRYAAIEWRNDKSEFQRWCEGRTGYPVVDAGMRELNATGFMHNRARMITASFLTKHLLVDWRRGERYFAEKLFDFELASNVGNWQWVAGCGCDAAPYFRVFNPLIQAKKFDPDGKYVTRWVAEHNTSRYPQPIVDHQMAQRRAVMTYRRALGKGASQ